MSLSERNGAVGSLFQQWHPPNSHTILLPLSAPFNDGIDGSSLSEEPLSRIDALFSLVGTRINEDNEN